MNIIKTTIDKKLKMYGIQFFNTNDEFFGRSLFGIVFTPDGLMVNIIYFNMSLS